MKYIFFLERNPRSICSCKLDYYNFRNDYYGFK